MVMYVSGDSIASIAKEIGRDKSTISREVRRNTPGNAARRSDYRAWRAQGEYERRHLRCKRTPILEDVGTYELVARLFLDERFSPEQIEGRLILERGSSPVSDSTIYRGIHAGIFDCLLPRKRQAKRRLRHRGKRRKRHDEKDARGKLRISRYITERPAEADMRCRLGDWESDTVLGKQGGACLVTNIDRKSGYVVGGKAARKGAEEVGGVMVSPLEGLPVHTITPDRGKEFAMYDHVSERLGAEFYFALPHHPWERGTNENANGLLREYFPKGESLDVVSDEEVQIAFAKLNRRPRKRHGYLTPYEVFYSTKLHLV